jgi:uncharacterized RDD family membrane protein YckC
VGLRLPPSGFVDRTAPRGGVRYAGWLRRAGGYVIDVLLIGMINYVLSRLLVMVVGPFFQGYVYFLLVITLFASISIVYAALCLAKLQGQTPGMRVMQIRCVPVSGRATISMPQSVTRALAAEIVTAVPLYFRYRYLWLELVLLLAYVWPAIDQRRQTWWDHLAATMVLDDRWN